MKKETRHFVSIVFAGVAVIVTSIFVYLPDFRNESGDFDAVTRGRMRQLSRLCYKFHEQAKAWPTNGAMLAYFYPDEDKDTFKDGWGREIIFQVSTNGNGELKLISYGLDVKPGGKSGNAIEVTLVGAK